MNKPDEFPVPPEEAYDISKWNGPIETSVADWDACDEHETTFPKGDACPACLAELGRR